MKKRPTLRIETDPISLLRFLEDNNAIHNLEPEDVNTNCLIIRAEIDGETVAYVWGQWLDMETTWLHAFSKGRLWCDQETWDDIILILRFFSIERVACQPIGPTTSAMRRVLLRRGFVADGNELILELEHGRKEEVTEGAEASDYPTGSPGAAS